MPHQRHLAAVAALAGLTAAFFTVDLAGPRAESPMEFFTKQRRQVQPSYERQAVPVQRYGYGDRYSRDGRRGFFGEFVEDFFHEGPPRRRTAGAGAGAASSASMQRVICKRQCDGAQLVLGILPSRGKHKEQEAMCAAAGGVAETQLVVEKFVPGAGFAAPVMTASAAPLLEGRASLDTSARPARPAASSSCPAQARQAFMTVPILHDSTLRHGDVVAAKGGFKVFVGKGKPPFKQRDFVDLDTRKKVSSDLRKLKVADR